MPEEFLAPLYGSAMHKALPLVMLTGDVDKAFAAFKSVWHADGKINPGDEKRNDARARLTIEHFHFTHKARKSLYLLESPPVGSFSRDDSTSDYEVAWEIDIGLPIPLIGYFDSFCTHRDTGETWIWELKTNGARGGLSSYWFESFEMHPQVLTYAMVGKMLGQPVKGVMLEGVLVDKKKTDNQSWPIMVMEHHLEGILEWLRQKGEQLLACEADAENMRHLDTSIKKDFYQDGAKAFWQDWSGCTPMPHFYVPGWRCDFSDLCRVPDWRMMTSSYVVQPERAEVKLTVKGATV